MLKVMLPNFSAGELECRCCGMFSYRNKFLTSLQAFRYALGAPMVITCGCRCKKHNSEVGGAQNSLHIGEGKKASAVDFYTSDLPRAYKLACEFGLFNEVIWYRSQKFIHIGQDPDQVGDYHVIKL